MDEGSRCISDRELLERMVVLETESKEREQANKEALILAREILSGELELARQQMADKIESHNQWQKRWDRNEGVLATKQEVTDKLQVLEDKHVIRIRAIERLVYIGVGLAIAISYVMRYVKL